jgi:hypothetical protein
MTSVSNITFRVIHTDPCASANFMEKKGANIPEIIDCDILYFARHPENCFDLFFMIREIFAGVSSLE